jgi:uncharacterized protein
MKLSKYLLTTDPLDDAGIPGKRIIFSTRTATSVLIEESIYQSMIASDLYSITPEFLDKLIDKEFVVPDGQDEFEYVLNATVPTKRIANFYQ